MAKLTLLYFGQKAPPRLRKLLSQWNAPLLLVKNGDYPGLIRKGEYGAYLLSRFWAEHDYGMPLPSSDGITLLGAPRLGSSDLPANRVYLVPRWPNGRSEAAYRAVWIEVAAAMESYSTVAVPIGLINCVAAPVGMMEFENSSEAEATINAFFSAIAPLAREE